MKKLMPYIEIAFIAFYSVVIILMYRTIQEKKEVIEKQKTHIQMMDRQIEMLEDQAENFDDAVQQYEGEVSMYGRLYELYRDGKYKEAKELEKQYFSNPQK